MNSINKVILFSITCSLIVTSACSLNNKEDACLQSMSTITSSKLEASGGVESKDILPGTWETSGSGPRSNSHTATRGSSIAFLEGEGCTYADMSGEPMFSDESFTSVEASFVPTMLGTSPKGGNDKAKAGLLSAGNYSDAKNLESLKSFWTSLLQSENSDSIPDYEEIIIKERFTNQVIQSVNISFVVDVTGSMGDELEYLKKEIEYISNQIKTNYPKIKQKFSIIAYRDQGDQYVTRGIKFTSDLKLFKKFLNLQFAAGGGNYPEAMHEALDEANTLLDWSGKDTANLLFLIADAPPHQEFLKDVFQTIRELKNKNVTVYPVAASGVNKLTEGVMRFGAAVTGGEYIFITDDSGIGNSHKNPDILCYQVTQLKDQLINKISEEIIQKQVVLSSEKIIRTYGDIVDGICRSSQDQ